MNFDSIIIGAGISGLVAAYKLKKLGRDVLLMESGNQVGGVIESSEVEGFLLETGPNSFRGTHELLDLVEELELMGELVTADPRAPAYVYSGGELHAVPMSPHALINTKLLTTSAKLRLLREPFINRRSVERAVSLPDVAEEAIASFVRRRLGPEILDKLVAPFLSGVYAGDSDQLSVQACFPKLARFEAEAGSILRGALKAVRASRTQNDKPRRSLRPYRLCSFRRGLDELPKKLAASLSNRLLTETRITNISKNNGLFEVAAEQRGENKTFNCRTLILAAPAFAAAKLVETFSPEIAQLLADIHYVSIASVPLAYRSEQVARKLDGFGFLAPRREGLRTLGSIWNSSLFADRAPQGWVVTTNFIGGATDPEAASLSDDELIGIVHNDLSRVLGITGEARRLPIKRWQRAIPQYNLGHAARVAKLEIALRQHRGLWIVGNYLRGVSLGDCVKDANTHAEETADWLAHFDR